MPRAKEHILNPDQSRKPKDDLTGRKFNRWTVIDYAGRNKSNVAHWTCRCECGNERFISTGNLTQNTSKSCGKCHRFKDISGQKFHRLTTIKPLGERDLKGGGCVFWECLCECGKTSKVRSTHLMRGLTKSCGCLQKEAVRKSASLFLKTHGMSKTSEAHIWNTMKQRCGNPSNGKYSDYGGRGISVCQSWLDSFENFFADMGHRPSKGHSIDRRDNEGNYCPENCYWATRKEQAANKRNNVSFFFFGVWMKLIHAADKFGINSRVLYHRIHCLKWNPDRAAQTPERKKECDLMYFI